MHEKKHAIQDQACDAILAASEVERPIYSIGPYGIRVGFKFQQERALNLIYALHFRQLIRKNSRIAIIGGGFAGLTARLGLQGLGYGMIELFERSFDVLQVQRSATHRPVHPSYNDWPIAERFSATTNLPFLNWYAASAGDVVGSLRKVWKETYEPSLKETRFDSEVTSVKVEEDLRKEQKVVKIGLKDDNRELEFDCVIFATGFGEEVELKHSLSTSYWRPDGLVH